MRYNIELTHDQCDTITVISLKESYLHHKFPLPDEGGISNDPDLEFLRAVDMVLEYFLSADGIKQWKLEKCLMDDKRVLDR